MGNPLTTLRKPQKTTISSEAIALVQHNFNDQMSLFTAQISAESEIQNTFTYTHQLTSNLEATIRDSVRDFSSGSIATGLGDLGVQHITEMIAMEKGERFSRSVEALTINTVGHVTSLEILFLVYGFASSELVENNHVIGVCVVLTPVETTPLKVSYVPMDGPLLISPEMVQLWVERCFPASSVDVKESIRKRVKEIVRGVQSEMAVDPNRLEYWTESD